MTQAILPIFISWSDELRRQLVKVLRQRVPSAVRYVKTCFTRSDIGKGGKWSLEISKRLRESGAWINALLREDFIVLSFVIFSASSAYSQSLEAQSKALAEITKTADAICSIVAHSGKYEGLNVKGDVKAQLSGLIKQLVDLGISGAGDYTTEQYENVIQADLGAAIQRNAECKLGVFNKLADKMIK